MGLFGFAALRSKRTELQLDMPRRSIEFAVFQPGGIDPGDELEVDLTAGVIKDLTNGEMLTFSPLPDVMITILNDGGLAAHIQKHGDFKLG